MSVALAIENNRARFFKQLRSPNLKNETAKFQAEDLLKLLHNRLKLKRAESIFLTDLLAMKRDNIESWSQRHAEGGEKTKVFCRSREFKSYLAHFDLDEKLKSTF